MSTSKTRAVTHTSDYERWELPQVSDTESGKAYGHLTAAKLEAIENEAREEGLKNGYQEGYAKGLEQYQSEVADLRSQVSSLMNGLIKPFEDLDEEVVEQTAALAIAISRQLIRRELHTEPGQVIGVVREALSALPVSARKVRVHLHPDDAELVRDVLSLHDEDDSDMQPWRVIEEPLLSRGGCRIQAENSVIDATVETRLQRIITAILGGERADD